MSTLFDVSPEEPTRRRGARKKADPPVSVSEPEKKPFYSRELPPRAIKALGRLDHTHECSDARCRGSAHDIIHEDGGSWLIQCCFCNTAQWVPVIKGHLKPKQEEFVFRDGRFAGLSIDDALEQPRGREYVAWAAESHPRQVVRDACRKHIDGSREAI